VRQKVIFDLNQDGRVNQKEVETGDAEHRFIGAVYALLGNDLPYIGEIMPAVVLTNVLEEVEVWVDEVRDANGISDVWVEISAPTNSLGALTVSNQLDHVSGGRYNKLIQFPQQGVYELTFFARDEGGDTSLSYQATVTQTADPAYSWTAFEAVDAFEPDNVVTNARLVELPSVQYHTLHYTNDCDMVRFFAHADQVYDIETQHLTNTIDTVIELYRELPDGSTILIDRVDEFGREEGELTGLNFPDSGYYLVRVCHASDAPYEPGGYYLVIHVPAGFQGVNVYAWDVINNVPISGASVNLSGSNGTTDGNGVVHYPSAGRGSYSASVTAPGGNQYVPLFGTISASDTSTNANSAYGNARSLNANSFGTVAYSGVSLADTAYMVFGFVPVSYVIGSVKQETYGLPVEEAFVGFYRDSDNALFRAYPWASYGTPWLTDVSGSLPSETILLPNTPYRMEIIRAGYEPLVQNITTPAKGGTLDLGRLDARLRFGGNAIPDIWEQFYGLPTNVDVNLDGDLDGMTHYQEFIAGTIPTDGSSRFVLPGLVQQANGDLTIRWTAEPNRRYRVLHTPDLKAPVTWTPVYTPLAVPAREEIQYGHPSGDAKGFLRVDVQFP
jgi:hypothetical protein